jgi:hypothetical protein
MFTNHQKREVEVLACDECGCTWLHSIEVNRYVADTVPMSMKTPTIHDQADFHLLVCVSCGRTVFPKLEGFQAIGKAYDLYSEMREEVTGCTENPQPLDTEVVEKKTGSVWGHLPPPPPSHRRRG